MAKPITTIEKKKLLFRIYTSQKNLYFSQITGIPTAT